MFEQELLARHLIYMEFIQGTGVCSLNKRLRVKAQPLSIQVWKGPLVCVCFCFGFENMKRPINKTKTWFVRFPNYRAVSIWQQSHRWTVPIYTLNPPLPFLWASLSLSLCPHKSLPHPHPPRDMFVAFGLF